MKELRWALKALTTTARVMGWVAATMWLGTVATWRLGVLVSRWRQVMAETRFCHRGHVTPMYGVYECRCGALVEDWVFARCRVCGQSAGWTPCTTCGLPIKNPLNV
jgi:hypothetical protein